MTRGPATVLANPAPGIYIVEVELCACGAYAGECDCAEFAREAVMGGAGAPRPPRRPLPYALRQTTTVEQE